MVREADNPPFDRVTVTREGQQTELTLREFIALPLDERVALILERAVEFHRDGELVERQDALRFLRVWRGPR